MSRDYLFRTLLTFLNKVHHFFCDLHYNNISLFYCLLDLLLISKETASVKVLSLFLYDAKIELWI